ncbi:MAG: tRNA pseudouridine(55) synthase TruB [Bacteroidetes bacterium]|nr:tRNA pseudouridine(55) synthase TruB [Bacteroidota bacterium]
MIAKNQNDLLEPDFASGEIILIDKGIGFTSFNAVYKIRKTVNVKKVGHAGTLDPLATGLLILCTGKKTKEISSFQDLRKTYSGVITLGKRTASLDSEGEFIEEKGIDGISESMILESRNSFLGKILQTPPMYSALKVKGKRLYKYARNGIEIERMPREVEIYKFDIEKIELPDVHFVVECSKGTYIRTLADDLGTKLNCGGYLSKLRREKIGEFDVSDAFTIDEFQKKYSRPLEAD